jgi:hypothetical protein
MLKIWIQASDIKIGDELVILEAIIDGVRPKAGDNDKFVAKSLASIVGDFWTLDTDKGTIEFDGNASIGKMVPYNIEEAVAEAEAWLIRAKNNPDFWWLAKPAFIVASERFLPLLVDYATKNIYPKMEESCESSDVLK